MCGNCLIDTFERAWVLRYNRTAVEFPKDIDVSRYPTRNSEDFSSPTCEHVHTRTRGHDKNDTLTIQTKRMKQTFRLMVQIDDSHWRGKVIKINDEETIRWLNYHLNKGLSVSVEKDSDND